AAVHDEEKQDIDRPVSRVIVLALFDRAGDRRPARVSFQDLEVGLLVGTDHPDALPGQSRGVPIAPEDLLGTLLEPGVDPSRAPVQSAMWLEVHLGMYRPDSAIADGQDDSSFNRFASQ